MALDLSWLGSIGTGISSVVNSVSSIFQNSKNNQNTQRSMALDNAKFSYQKQQDALTREREDNAVQRRAEDMRLAGFNPNSEFGAAAATQTSTPSHTPARAVPAAEVDSQGLAAMAQLDMQKKLNDAQVSKIKAETQRIVSELPDPVTGEGGLAAAQTQAHQAAATASLASANLNDAVRFGNVVETKLEESQRLLNNAGVPLTSENVRSLTHNIEWALKNDLPTGVRVDGLDSLVRALVLGLTGQSITENARSVGASIREMASDLGNETGALLRTVDGILADPMKYIFNNAYREEVRETARPVTQNNQNTTPNRSAPNSPPARTDTGTAAQSSFGNSPVRNRDSQGVWGRF